MNLKKIFVVTLVLVPVLFVSSSMQIKTEKPALSKKASVKQFMNGPLAAFEKQLNKITFQMNPAAANLQAHSSKTSPDQCSTATNLEDLWDELLSCLFVTLAGIYNTFTSTLASVGVNPDNDTTLQYSNSAGTTMTFVAQASTQTGYERMVQITDASGNICMVLHYNANPDNKNEVKLHFYGNFGECDESGTEQRSLSMAVDLKRSNPEVQTANFFSAGNADKTTAFEPLTASAGDDLFNMDATLTDQSNGTVDTLVHVLRISDNGCTRLYVNGIDDGDPLHVGGNLTAVAVTDTNVDSTGLTLVCYDNTNSNETVSSQSCGTFQNFPRSCNDIKDKNYPTFTSSNFTFQTDVTQYYN